MTILKLLFDDFHSVFLLGLDISTKLHFGGDSKIEGLDKLEIAYPGIHLFGCGWLRSGEHRLGFRLRVDVEWGYHDIF